MGNISRAFDAKAFARMLKKAPCAPEARDRNENAAGAAIQNIDGYVYERLFLPIAAGGPIPLEGLDFGKITCEDLEDLADALYNCGVFELLGLANTFDKIAPAASAKQMFI
jgi:hypothetical protein